MRSVAQRAGAAVLAAAEIHGLRLIRLEFYGGEFAALVTSVTERLGCTFAAGTPPVAFSGFYLNDIGRLLSDNGLLV